MIPDPIVTTAAAGLSADSRRLLRRLREAGVPPLPPAVLEACRPRSARPRLLLSDTPLPLVLTSR